MGRRRIAQPTRDEKERVRKPRTRLFINSEKLSKLGADVFVAVRYYDEVHYYTSCPTMKWPLDRGDLLNARPFRDQRKTSSDKSDVAADKEPQSLITSKNPLAINLRSPPILQASPIDERNILPQMFAFGNTPQSLELK